MLRARVTEDSQPHMLRYRLNDAKIRHNQTARVNIRGVEIRAHDIVEGGGVRFCHVKRVKVRKVLTPGDGAPLPHAATVEGLEVRTEGRYDLVNALLQTNGQMCIVVDQETKVRPEGTLSKTLKWFSWHFVS